MAKKFSSPWYTETKTRYERGKFKTVTSPEGYLFAKGQYNTKIQRTDLPDYFREVYNREKVFANVKDIVDVFYKPNYWSTNHLYKDDFLYISWKEKIHEEQDQYGWTHTSGYELLLFGWAVKDFVDAALEYAEGNMREKLLGIQKVIAEKVVWYVHLNPDRYELMNDYCGVIPDVTFITRPMEQMSKPLSVEEQIQAMDDFCKKHQCNHVNTIHLETEDDVRKLSESLPSLPMDQAVRPVFLCVTTMNYTDKGEDHMQMWLWRQIKQDQATIHDVYVKRDPAW